MPAFTSRTRQNFHPFAHYLCGYTVYYYYYYTHDTHHMRPQIKKNRVETNGYKRGLKKKRKEGICALDVHYIFYKKNLKTWACKIRSRETIYIYLLRSAVLNHILYKGECYTTGQSRGFDF